MEMGEVGPTGSGHLNEDENRIWCRKARRYTLMGEAMEDERHEL
jgi:hypothetical protein